MRERFGISSDAGTPDKASVTTTAVEGKGKVNGATATSVGNGDRMLPLRNSASDKRRGRALWRYLDPPDRLLSAKAKEVNSPCGKVGEKNTLI